MGRIFERLERRSRRDRLRNGRRWRDARDRPFTEGQAILSSGAIGPSMPTGIDGIGR